MFLSSLTVYHHFAARLAVCFPYAVWHLRSVQLSSANSHTAFNYCFFQQLLPLLFWNNCQNSPKWPALLVTLPCVSLNRHVAEQARLVKCDMHTLLGPCWLQNICHFHFKWNSFFKMTTVSRDVLPGEVEGNLFALISWKTSRFCCSLHVPGGPGFDLISVVKLKQNHFKGSSLQNVWCGKIYWDMYVEFLGKNALKWITVM